MKYIFVVLALLVLALPKANGQKYNIDLSKVKATNIKDLKMGDAGPKGKEILVNNLYMSEGGVPLVPVMGEFHYSRHDHRYWKDALLKMKASGITVVSTYILWILHEEIEGQQNWTGNNNLRKFVELCHELDMKVHIRIGPYCNAEIRNGGFPDWIAKNKNFRTRSNDPLYLAQTRKWYQSVFKQVDGLFYKDEGPIIAVQLENEFVTKGLVVSHLMNLKQIAIEEGFDAPLYTMTHWMASDYPRGEIVPYAGYYIETPWTYNDQKTTPPSAFEFFSYNRLSDNIGTDIIKIEGDVESLEGDKNESPYFTCEVGVGTTSFYKRRAVIPEEMAGENINLRLGCGVNLMGYYMYTGGSNPTGVKTTLQSSGPIISYDYQAPVREFGDLGIVMKETKKLNYFMNDFGEVLAPAIAYLPKTNSDTTNLQWAVRTDGKSGFLFCSNYLYKHSRKDYKNVQFDLKLKDSKLKIPRKKVTVPNEAYFLWPFNQNLGGIALTYATVQPICVHKANNVESYFFFADDQISGEYLIEDKDIKGIRVLNGKSTKEQNTYFVDQLQPGTECMVEITKNDGNIVRLITLTEEQSDYIWKGKTKGQEFVAITKSTLMYDDTNTWLTDYSARPDVWLYNQGPKIDKQSQQKQEVFSKYTFETAASQLRASFEKLKPMHGANWISPKESNVVKCNFDGQSLSPIDKVVLRYKADGNARPIFNDKEVKNADIISYEAYSYADITSGYVNGNNELSFELEQPREAIVAQVEVEYVNGVRRLWNTDLVWTDGKTPVNVDKVKSLPMAYDPKEHLAIYACKTPNINDIQDQVKLNISLDGDYAKAYIGDKFVNDHFCNGEEWILGIDRYKELLSSEPLVIKLVGFKSENEKIYLEKNVNMKDGVNPIIRKLDIKKEYTFRVY